MSTEEIFDVIVVGGGAAGLTAGIYSSRARLSTLILNEGAIGGQMVLTDEIANQEKPNLGAAYIEGISYIAAAFVISWCV